MKEALKPAQLVWTISTFLTYLKTVLKIYDYPTYAITESFCVSALKK